MIFFGGALGLLAIGVWIFCIIDAITTPKDQVRTLPKLAWVAIVVFLIDLGSIAWLVAGRPWNAKATTPRGAGSSGGGSVGGGFGMSATSLRRAPSRPMSPDDDDEFLASLSKRTPPPQKPDDETGPSTGKNDEGPQPVG